MKKRNYRLDMLKRVTVLAVVMLGLFSLNIGRIFYLQTVRGAELSEKADSQQLSDTEVSAMRGTIYDDEGNVLAQSATVWNIYLDPSNITDDETRDFVVENLSRILKLDEKGKAELLEKSKKKTRYAVVAEKVENAVKEEISAFKADKANKKYKLSNIIGTEQTTRRYYPFGDFASSVLGFVGNDNQGLYGIEKYYDEQLTGTNGRIITVKDANGRKLPSDYETKEDAVDGYSLTLTLNQTIQYYLEKGLRQTMAEYKCKGAYGVVMDCNTGAVLAMSSLPDFNCNEPYKITNKQFINSYKRKVKEEKEKEIERLKKKGEKTDDIDLSDKAIAREAESLVIQNQWRNFTVSDTYVPGSVFKTFMSSAALEENVVTLDTTYTCTGSIQVADYTMKCHYHPGHGTQNLTQGLENSCNPFFITVGQKLGVHKYFKYFEAFGFTQKTGIDLPGEAMSQYVPEEKYGIVELSSASFGQTNSLTPLQVCTGISAIANGGTLLKPYIVSEIRDSNGNTVSKTEKTEVRRVISEETSEKVRNMMKAVVDEGTGKNGYVAGYSVGGKTGTSTKLGESAEGEKDKYIVSFAAIAPSDDPQIAMIILIDEPNEDLGGGALCAPIAAQVVEQAMLVRNVEPKYDEEELKKLSIATPMVVGETADSAEKLLKEKNLRCRVIGDGEKIISQSPIAGSGVPTGGTVVVYTEKDKKKTVKVPDFVGLTVSEANSAAAEAGLNIEISGNNLSTSSVVAYRQSTEKGTEVEIGTVVTVTFKNTHSVLD
ncbi:MAG: PASTA domain-containing protein [Eubacterium sp.]|nr:PASTA domain-containing protein [Eubacterium sp.]